MPVVNGAPNALTLSRSCPWQIHNTLATQPAFNVLRILAHHQPVANELARYAVEDTLEGEDGVFADPCRNLLKLGSAAHRQGLEHGALGDQELGRTRIHALHDGVDKCFVITTRIKAATAA